MYAIIKSGGKQYRVDKDAIIDVELLPLEPGAQLEFGEVLFVHNGKKALVGNPVVKGYTVRGELLGTVAGEKITSIKYKPSVNQRRKFGHRQHRSRIRITEIGQLENTKE